MMMGLTCESRSHSTVLASRFAARSWPVWPRTITIIDYDHRKDAASDAELIARQQAAEIEAPGEELAQLTLTDL